MIGHPPQVPGVAGFPLGYHLGTDLVRAAALRWAGTDPWDSLSRLDVTLWALGLVLALRAVAARLGAAPLAVGCPTCGASNQPGEKFCGECATPLAAGTGAPAAAASRHPAPAPGAAPAAVAERRLVSVLFADLVGFTSRSDSTDPEQVREFLARYFELSREIIERYADLMDGVQLDFMRQPFLFPPGTGEARRDLMTEFIAQVRAVSPENDAPPPNAPVTPSATTSTWSAATPRPGR